MALYKDGNPVSGLNSIPRLTLAQYNALNVKPEFWVRTDAPESYKKLSADQVSYDENTTVKDKLDGMIESGSNANGRYIKYADGTMICTNALMPNVEVNTAWGSLYISPNISLGDFAQEFYGVPSLTVSNLNSDSAWVTGVTGVTKTSAGTTNLIRATTGTARDRFITYIAIGRWKA